ncbi:biliverdin-producing heme oxygenase [Salinimicrobium sediminis]|nr:biliverdin-producing heme oxygenase [Salinimicrobium sediminis]
MMIRKLKEETRWLHEQIEDQNLATKIMDHSIDLPTYKLLLLQNYIAYRETENEIKNHLPNYKAGKHLQLKQDLENLKVSTTIPVKNVIFECHSPAEALGAAYVVEGSALGGMLLAKNLQHCIKLNEVDRHYFFNGDKENLKDWNSFKKELEAYNFNRAEEEEAIQKAKATFLFFEKVFNMDFPIS